MVNLSPHHKKLPLKTQTAIICPECVQVIRVGAQAVWIRQNGSSSVMHEECYSVAETRLNPEEKTTP